MLWGEGDSDSGLDLGVATGRLNLSPKHLLEGHDSNCPTLDWQCI